MLNSISNPVNCRFENHRYICASNRDAGSVKATVKTRNMLALVRNGQPITLGQQLELTLRLSMPAIMAQLSSIVMQYIDASMVGRLGASQPASIGIVSTTTWLFNGLCAAAVTGFAVQAAHLIGANDNKGARNVLRQSIVAIALYCTALSVVGVSISKSLPVWLGGSPDILDDASAYFFIFAMFLPALQFSFLSGSMLRCSGNMQVPSVLSVMMCIMDVVFNAILIFPSHEYDIFGFSLSLPGADMGVRGAALGTALAEVVTAALMTSYLIFRSPELKLTQDKGSFKPTKQVINKAFRISLPVACERVVMCGAQIVSTGIVAPIGVNALAANSFAITAESLCYMPGYGVSEAATTLVGQCVGAKRRYLTKRFSRITVLLGIAVMTIMGGIMYIAAPLMMSIMTPIEEIQELGVAALRIEAFAEPMFAAAIVSYGVFVGAGDTLVPSLMNFGSMWAVRLTLAAMLAPSMGLKGVWIAMCIELCFRGLIFLWRLKSGRWMKIINEMKQQP